MVTFNVLNRIFNFNIKRKPKKSITLQEFYDAVGEVAKERNQSFFHVSIKKGSHSNGLFSGLSFTGYINGTNHENGLTIEEVCEKLRNTKKVEKVSPVETVTIELETA